MAFTILILGGKIFGGKIEVFNILGQKIVEINIKDSFESIIDIINVANGTYLVKISDDFKTLNKFLIKK